jgi:hypothetical protein
MESMECSICTEELQLMCFTYNNPIDLFKTSCGHHFHKSCISRWCQTNNTCPNCRKKNIYSFSNPVNQQNGFIINTYINNSYINNININDTNNNNNNNNNIIIEQ